MRSSIADSLGLLIVPTTDARYREIAHALRGFGERALRFAAESAIRVVALDEDEEYADVSDAIRRLRVRLDRWPRPPAGLFVVAERTMYLRSLSTMTVAHEFGHALDCALGSGTYRSASDERVRTAFASARAFVTPYAATGLDEYFAEALRAYVGANDADSAWPRATPRRLAALDPAMYRYVHELFQTAF